MSSSRERFEAWVKTQPQFAVYMLSDSDATKMYPISWTAWQARDAEVERLVAALREARQEVHEDERMMARIDALLREYNGEKPR